MSRKRLSAVLATVTLLVAMPVHAAERLTLFDLRLGTAVDAMPPSDAFKNYACGSNGGPPLQPLSGWANFTRCTPEADGLYEVYSEYDDEAEYVARAHGDFPAGWAAGTAYRAFPLITSALFDEAGVLAGLRIVTDPRPEQRDDGFLHFRPRQEHYLLGLYLAAKFGIAKADCRDLPLAARETPVLGMIVNRVCDAKDVARHESIHIEQRYLRRPGESDVDPQTGLLTTGAFESETRAEIRLSD
jgi:hypothetical protein